MAIVLLVLLHPVGHRLIRLSSSFVWDTRHGRGASTIVFSAALNRLRSSIPSEAKTPVISVKRRCNTVTKAHGLGLKSSRLAKQG